MVNDVYFKDLDDEDHNVPLTSDLDDIGTTIAYEHWWRAQLTYVFPYNHPAGEARPLLGQGDEREDVVDGDAEQEDKADDLGDEVEEDLELMSDDSDELDEVTDSPEGRHVSHS